MRCLFCIIPFFFCCSGVNGDNTPGARAYKWSKVTKEQLIISRRRYGCPDKRVSLIKLGADRASSVAPTPVFMTEQEVTELWVWAPPWSSCRIYTLAISKPKVVICWVFFFLFIFPSDSCKAAVWVWLIEPRSPPNRPYLCIAVQRSQTEQEINFTASSTLRLSLHLWVSPPCWDTFMSRWQRDVKIP